MEKKKKLSGGAIAGIVIAAVVVIVVIALIGMYNGMAQSREGVSAKESDIQNQLQRRADLIPNLVATVQQFTDHETEVLTAVTTAREKMAGSASTADKLEANEELSTALSRLLVVVENYPQLQSSQNFQQLQDELAGTENRIAAARQDYNEAAQSYNASLVTFPKNLFAGMFGFEKAPYFEASEGAEKAPDVSGLFDQ